MVLEHDRQMAWIYSLYRIGQFVATEAPENIERQLLEHLMTGFEASSGSIAFLDESGQNLTLAVAIGSGEKYLGSTINMGDGILGWVVQHQEPLLLSGGVNDDPRFKNLRPRQIIGSPASAMCWPLKFENKVIGALSINREVDKLPFTSADMTDGDAMIKMAGIVIDNVRLHVSQQDRIKQLHALTKKLASHQDELKKEKQEQQVLIKQLQATQEQLLQSEKMASIGQLAAGVAHEINNPVGYINSNIGSLKTYINDLFKILDAYENLEATAKSSDAMIAVQDLKKQIDVDYIKEDIQALMEESQEGVTRVKQIVEDLKDFSHVDEADWQWADLHQGINSTLNIAHNETKYKAEVIKEYGDIPQVECIASQLNQVFMNMLVNAAHAIEEHGTITIRTGTEGADHVWIEISDTGKGMSKDTAKRIFDPFFTTKPIGKGTGLGLSLSYGIIQKHGGRIDVESEVDKGTTFKIWLPVAQEEAKAVG